MNDKLIMSNNKANEFMEKFEKLIKEYNVSISVYEEDEEDEFGNTHMFPNGIEFYIEGDEHTYSRAFFTDLEITPKTKIQKFKNSKMAMI